MNDTSEPLAADPESVRGWLTPRFTVPGLVALSSTRNWTGVQTDDLDQAVRWALGEDRAGAEGIYTRVTTVKTRFPTGSRGSARDSRALVGMWSDIDFGNDLHKATNLPADATEARDIPRFAKLPDPTRVEHSGAGLYVWWEFEQPMVIGEDIDFDTAVQLAGDWQNILLTGAKKMGIGYGTGVKDLARVLRLPGTVNRKPGRTPALCQVTETGGPRYTLADIQDIAKHLRPAPPAKKTPPPARTQPVGGGRKKDSRFTGPGPLELLGDHACAAEILEFVGCTYREQYPGTCSYCGRDCQRWLRPGWSQGNSIDGIAVHKGGAAVTIRTDNFPGLPGGFLNRVLSPGQLFAALHHGGDESAAAKDIIRAAHGHDEATAAARALPAAVLGDVRQATALPAKESTPRARTYVHPARRLRALVAKVAESRGEDTGELLGWAARKGFAAGREAGAQPRAVADAFRKAAVRAGLENDLAMVIIRASYREAGK